MPSPLRRTLGPIALILASLAAAPLARGEDAPKEPPLDLHPTPGPARVGIGALADVELPESLVYLDAKDTQALLKRMGNIVGGSELAFVAPKDHEQGWFIVFDWSDVGHVKDDDKDKIDAAALLESIKEGCEERNDERKKLGAEPMHVVGWQEPPHYDARTNNLTWAVLYRDDSGGQVVNHNVRVLGRAGVMSVTLVEEPAKLAAARPAVDQVISAFSYRPGKKYAEWLPGDKVAEYGLAALVAAGGGAAAVKLGLFGFLAKLFAKGGKAIVALVVALGAGVVKFWNALRGKMSARPAPRRDDERGSGGAGFGA
jgi:uncharacterized membrane-anchored protein